MTELADTQDRQSTRIHQVFGPQNRVTAGPITAFSVYVREINRDQWQIWMNFIRKFKASYSTTFFGMFWAFVIPLVPIGVYTVLTSMRVVKSADDMPVVVFISLGVTIYGLITSLITETMSAVKGEKALLSKTHIGIFSVILGKFGSIVFDTLVRLSVICLLMVIVGGYPTQFSSLLFVPLAFVAVLSMLGAGLLLTIANLIFNDVEQVVSIIIRFGVFFSAVIFPLPDQGTVATIMQWNPLHTFVDGLRSLLVKGALPDPQLMLITCTVGLVMFVLGVTLLYRTEPHLRSAG